MIWLFVLKHWRLSQIGTAVLAVAATYVGAYQIGKAVKDAEWQTKTLQKSVEVLRSIFRVSMLLASAAPSAACGTATGASVCDGWERLTPAAQTRQFIIANDRRQPLTTRMGRNRAAGNRNASSRYARVTHDDHSNDREGQLEDMLRQQAEKAAIMVGERIAARVPDKEAIERIAMAANLETDKETIEPFLESIGVDPNDEVALRKDFARLRGARLEGSDRPPAEPMNHFGFVIFMLSRAFIFDHQDRRFG